MQFNETVSVSARVAKVAENFEAFLWADNNRPGAGATSSVKRINARCFEEVEVVDPMFPEFAVTTRYELKGGPKGTKINATVEIDELLVDLFELMGDDFSTNLAADAAKWGARLDAYIAQVELGGGAGRGVA